MNAKTLMLVLLLLMIAAFATAAYLGARAPATTSGLPSWPGLQRLTQSPVPQDEIRSSTGEKQNVQVRDAVTLTLLPAASRFGVRTLRLEARQGAVTVDYAPDPQDEESPALKEAKLKAPEPQPSGIAPRGANPPASRKSDGQEPQELSITVLRHGGTLTLHHTPSTAAPALVVVH